MLQSSALQVGILGIYVLLFAIAALSDVRRYVIPNMVVAGLIGLFVVARLLIWPGFPWTSHLAAGGSVLAIGLLAYRFRVLAAGDVKLLAAASLWVGLENLLWLMVAVTLTGAALAIFLLAARYLLAAVAVARPTMAKFELHRTLIMGEGIPYGLAIAAGSIWVGAGLLVS